MIDLPPPNPSALDLYTASLHPALTGADAARVIEFSLAPMDRLGLPLWTVAMIGADGALSDGFGYGPTTGAAQASAWGETVEWYWSREMLRRAPRELATCAAMRARHGAEAVVDPVALNLHAGSDYDADATVVEWTRVTRHPSGAAAWVPIEFVAPRRADIVGAAGEHAEQLLAVPITNGSGAGPTREHAVAHGILELCQRDGNSVQYRAMDRGIVVDLAGDVRDPETRATLRHLDASGVEVIVKLAEASEGDLGLGLTNLYVVGYDRDPGRAPQPIMLSACGEASHPDREVALAKALREFTMARARKAFNHGPLEAVRRVAPPGYLEAFRPESMRSEDDRALAEMRRWSRLSHAAFYEMLLPSVYARRSTVRFRDLPHQPTSDAAALLALLTERLTTAGLDILYCDLTPPGSPAHVVKVVVPGLEVETMTYRRVGSRNLRRLLRADSALAGVSNPPNGALPIRLTATAEAALGIAPGAAWLDPAAVESAMGPLYALYREPGRHVIGFLDEAGR